MSYGGVWGVLERPVLRDGKRGNHLSLYERVSLSSRITTKRILIWVIATLLTFNSLKYLAKVHFHSCKTPNHIRAMLQSVILVSGIEFANSVSGSPSSTFVVLHRCLHASVPCGGGQSAIKMMKNVAMRV